MKTIIHGVEVVTASKIRRTDGPEGPVYDRKMKIRDATGNVYILHMFSTYPMALQAQPEDPNEATRKD